MVEFVVELEVGDFFSAEVSVFVVDPLLVVPVDVLLVIVKYIFVFIPIHKYQRCSLKTYTKQCI